MENIKNRQSFLDHLYHQLNTTPQKVSEHPYTLPHQLPEETLQNLTPEELMVVLQKACDKTQIKLLTTPLNNLVTAVTTVLNDYGNGDILIPQTKDWENYGLNILNDTQKIHLWNQAGSKREENIQLAQNSNIAISFPQFLLAESGTIAVETSDTQGRAFHFLPKHYLAIIPKSRLVPRMTQAAKYYNEKIETGAKIGSCLHFISGPSNSGDIEMQLVVGLHGPLAMTYLIIEDL